MSSYDFFFAKYELQRTVTFTVFRQFHWYLNSCSFLYNPMLYSHVLINTVCAYQMSYLETRAGPKMGRQILGDFGGTKMAIISFKIKTFKKNEKVLA